jgi:uncharacterized membrane protein
MAINYKRASWTLVAVFLIAASAFVVWIVFRREFRSHTMAALSGVENI